jgi:hypothetical protein
MPLRGRRYDGVLAAAPKESISNKKKTPDEVSGVFW